MEGILKIVDSKCIKKGSKNRQNEPMSDQLYPFNEAGNRIFLCMYLLLPQTIKQNWVTISTWSKDETMTLSLRWWLATMTTTFVWKWQPCAKSTTSARDPRDGDDFCEVPRQWELRSCSMMRLKALLVVYDNMKGFACGSQQRWGLHS